MSTPSEPLDLLHDPDRPRVTAVIIGRAGSKGFPGKNSRLLRGRPVVWYSLEDVAASCVDCTVISTDCPMMKRQAEDWILACRRTHTHRKHTRIVTRPPELASDTATVDAAVRHAVENDDADIVVILYGNVPIRPDGLIDRALAHLLHSGASSVQSYAPVGKYHPCWEVRLDKQGFVSPYVENTIYRRQDLPPLYVPDGGVIAVRRDWLFTIVRDQPHAFLGPCRAGILNAIGDVVDIDDPIDLAVAEAVLAREEEKSRMEAA